MGRYFNGNTSELTIGDVPSVDITGTTMTLCCFVSTTRTGIGVWQCVAGKFSLSERQYQLVFRDSAATLRWEVGDGANTDFVDGNTQYAINRLYHVCGVKDGTGANSLRLYVNGSLDNQTTSARTIANLTSSFRIGSNDVGEHARGTIAEVGLWDVALTPGEISSLASGVPPLSVQPVGLRGYWPICGLVSPEPDLARGAAATVVSASPASHPFVNASYCGMSSDALVMRRSW